MRVNIVCQQSIILFLLVIFCFSLISCNSSSDEDSLNNGPNDKTNLNSLNCVDYVNLGDQESELKHEGLFGWEEERATVETSYRTEDYYDKEGVSLRSGKYELGVVLNNPKSNNEIIENESDLLKNLSLVIIYKTKILEEGVNFSTTKVLLGKNITDLTYYSEFEQKNEFDVVRINVSDMWYGPVYVMIDDKENFNLASELSIAFIGLCE